MNGKPGMEVDGVFYASGDKLRIKVANETHDCIFNRAHWNEFNPEIMVLRVKSITSGEKYAINFNYVDRIERIIG